MTVRDTKETRLVGPTAPQNPGTQLRKSSVIVNIRSVDGPGLADLLVFAGGIGTIIFVWAVLLVGRFLL